MTFNRQWLLLTAESQQTEQSSSTIRISILFGLQRRLFLHELQIELGSISCSQAWCRQEATH